MVRKTKHCNNIYNYCYTDNFSGYTNACSNNNVNNMHCDNNWINAYVCKFLSQTVETKKIKLRSAEFFLKKYQTNP